MIAGGMIGSFAGAGLFRVLQNSGQIDLVIGFLYVLLLGGIGGLMLKDALVALGWVKISEPKGRPRHNRWIASLPLRDFFGRLRGRGTPPTRPMPESGDD